MNQTSFEKIDKLADELSNRASELSCQAMEGEADLMLSCWKDVQLLFGQLEAEIEPQQGPN